MPPRIEVIKEVLAWLDRYLGPVRDLSYAAKLLWKEKGFSLSVILTLAVCIAAHLRSQLYGVRPTEPSVLVSVGALLGLAALVACLLPARRATRIDPVVALRQE